MIEAVGSLCPLVGPRACSAVEGPQPHARGIERVPGWASCRRACITAIRGRHDRASRRRDEVFGTHRNEVSRRQTAPSPWGQASFCHFFRCTVPPRLLAQYEAGHRPSTQDPGLWRHCPPHDPLRSPVSAMDHSESSGEVPEFGGLHHRYTMRAASCRGRVLRRDKGGTSPLPALRRARARESIRACRPPPRIPGSEFRWPQAWG